MTQSHTCGISIHSLRMEGDGKWIEEPESSKCISIHSLRMEGDDGKFIFEMYKGISIHSLRMEGDFTIPMFFFVPETFQSTPSAWRETTHTAYRFRISSVFQSTPSAWRETRHDRRNEGGVDISIHSLRMEGDLRRLGC